MVQKGKLEAGTAALVMALNKVDLPTLGNPTMPTLSAMPHDKTNCMDRIPAFAKINLFLIIVGRAQGFHQLQSLFQTVSLADEIGFEEVGSTHGKNVATISGADFPSNLILKAYELLADDFRSNLPSLSINLKKNIPIAAGLGGGSSNAAATLVYLNQKYKLGISVEQLKLYGAKLGSDVPFFIEGGTQLVTGRGEICNPVMAVPSAWVLLVNPRVPCSTPLVFKNYTESKKEFSKPIEFDFLQRPYTWEQLKTYLKNDLLEAAITVVPQIREIIQQLESTQALYAGLSGSGATCFGIYKTRDQAENAYKQFESALFRFVGMLS
jgi:4-diphosphocytidyl-2-C-methyl-D-erythritol kinase